MTLTCNQHLSKIQNLCLSKTVYVSYKRNIQVIKEISEKLGILSFNETVFTSETGLVV